MPPFGTRATVTPSVFALPKRIAPENASKVSVRRIFMRTLPIKAVSRALRFLPHASLDFDMFRRCGHAILIAAAFLAGASANWNDTSPGINLDKLPHPALTEIRSGILKQGQRVIFDRITALAQSNGVRLRGRAKSGKPWEAHICYGCFNEVWRADLDGNGIPDYVFFGGGPYFNGRNTPLYSLTILLMDRERLPVPFFFPVYYGERGEGIKHLIGQNGRAELLISSYDEATSDPHVGPFCSGHWITQLYRFRNLAVEEVRGEMGGIDFPFVHDWTYRGGECAELEKPIPIQGPTFNEQGTSAKGEVTAHIRGLGMNGAVTIDSSSRMQNHLSGDDRL